MYIYVIFYMQAVFGWSIFNETLNLLWWTGSGFIIVGLLLMHNGINKSNAKLKDV